MSERPVDPWSDMPRWSDDHWSSAAAGETHRGDEAPRGSTAAQTTVGDAPDGPEARPDAGMSPHASGTAAVDGAPTCPWCATPAADGASRCTSCGAALAQREAIGDLVIPGLTAVDPALKDLDGRPLHLTGPSPSHGVASGVVVAAAAGGPLGLAILGGVGAVAAAEYLGASRGISGPRGHDGVGAVSEAVLHAVERLERGEPLPRTDDRTPGGAPDAPTRASGPQSAPPGDRTEDATDGH